EVVELQPVGWEDHLDLVEGVHSLQRGEELAERSSEIIEHHHERLDTLVNAAAQTPENELSVPEYSKHLFKPRSWGPMADSETYAHLEHLRQSGRATTRAVDGELRYRITA
ncbi:MAG: hypothetical protein AAGK32_16235, partial [Actinomycetota bacterium]